MTQHIFKSKEIQMRGKTVFLSHSSKDIEKVRRIRDILEALDYEPLLFQLKCLDDDNENLEAFIKKEIEARNIFIYCKSENSDKSCWVQKELEYIKRFDTKRLFTIDITLPLNQTLVVLLESITEIIKKNRIFISCSHAHPDKEFGDYLEKLLTDNNYDVVRFKILDYNKDNEHKIALQEAQTFIPIISPNSLESVYCKGELERALYNYENSPDVFSNKIVPIFYGASETIIRHSSILPSSLNDFNGIEISTKASMTAEEIETLLRLLNTE